MLNKRTVSRIASIGAMTMACGLAQAQYSSNFEGPTYTSGPGLGVLLTTGYLNPTNGPGQDGWYLPNASSNNGYVFTYAGNTWNLVTNPQGGAQAFAATPATGLLGRAQHNVDFSAGGVWLATFDCTGKFNGTALPASDNLASWSLQSPPLGATAFRGCQNLLNWGSGAIPGTTNYTATATNFHIGIGYYTADSPTTTTFGLPGPQWGDLPVDHWYRYSIKWTFGDQAAIPPIPPRILTCTIQDLTTGGPTTKVYVSDKNWYLQGGPLSTLPLPNAFRFFSGGGGAGSEVGGNVSAWDNVSVVQSSEEVGACCLANGGCSLGNQTACADVGGIFRGGGVSCESANCPLPGACCQENGTCTVTTQITCTSQGGLYRGENSACGNASCIVFGYSEGATDVGYLPLGPDTGFPNAAWVNGPGQRITKIRGTMDLDDTDMFKFQICDQATFSATTVGGTGLDTMLWLFNSAGVGVVMDDDSSGSIPQSTITTQFVNTNGIYYIAVTTFENVVAPGISYGRVAWDAANQPIWNPTNPGGAVFPEWAPNGPAAANPVTGWNGTTTALGGYVITLTGACSLGCYANCDQSTVAPVLNANDFNCFLNKYAAGEGIANCDNSSISPVLNANDFNCFLNAYAAGCP